MKVHVWENDEGLQIDDYEDTGIESFRSFWHRLIKQYNGFTVDFCYHNCDAPKKYMELVNSKVLEDCVELRLTQDQLATFNCDEVSIVTNETFNEFANLHDLYNPESSGMYWTSQRVLDDFDNWVIYLLNESYVLMRLGRSDVAEIYSLFAKDYLVGKSLMAKASEHAFKVGKKEILHMVEKDNHFTQDISNDVGYVYCGRYVAYRAIINNITKIQI